MRKDDPVLTMNRIHGILFDMDGVLFDSERALRSCWQELGDRLGLGDMTGVYQECLGVNTVSSGAILRRAYGEDFDWEGFRRESSALYLRRFGDGSLPVKPGAREILDFFRDRGLPLALASSTNGDLVRHFLGKAGLLSYFSVLVTGDMVSRSKPDPEIFLRACALLGIEPRQALVVEDSFNGVRAAWAGGMPVAMVPDLTAPDGEMERKANWIFPDLAALQRAFDRL